MSIFDSMKEAKAAKGGSRSGPSTMNPVIRISNVVVANTKAATPETDYVEGVLVTPAFGLDVGTDVKVKIAPRKPAADPDKAPMEIWDLQTGRKKGTGGRMGEGGAFVAENATMGTDGMITCRWIKVVEHKQQDDVNFTDEHVFFGSTSVGYLNKDNGAPTFQYRDLHLLDSAAVIKSSDDMSATEVFRQTVAHFLEDMSETHGGGKPAAMVRMAAHKELDQGHYMAAIIPLRWNSEAGAPHTPLESVDLWLSEENRERSIWRGFIENVDTFGDEATIEVWPVWRYPTAANKLKKDAGRPFHDAHVHSAPKIDAAGSIVYNDDGSAPKNEYGLLSDSGIMQVIQYEDAGDGGKRDWFANMSYTLERYPSRLFAASEAITENLPESTRAFFTERAENRVKTKAEYLRGKKNNNSGAQNDDSPEQQAQDFGDEKPQFSPPR